MSEKGNLQKDKNEDVNIWRQKTIEIRNKALYQAKSIPDIISIYIDILMQSNELVDLVHAEALQKYRDEIINKKYLSRLRKTFNSIYSFISQDDMNLCFSIEGRRKSFISADNKILKILKDILLSDVNQSEEFTKLLKELKDHSLIKDTHAFRIIIFNSSKTSLYKLQKNVVKHFTEKGSTLLEIKDYLKNPKENGYQSIHAIIKSSTGEFFEIQFRTFEMHMLCETGPASHLIYKPKDTSFDRSLIKIPGYGFKEEKDQNGNLIIDEIDLIGLSKSLQILQRQKTYSI